MRVRYSKLARSLIYLGLFVAVSSSIAAEAPVRVKVYGVHDGMHVTYHYALTNISSRRDIYAFDIGWNRPKNSGDLRRLPIDWRHGRESAGGMEILLGPHSTKQPPGWAVEVMAVEEDPAYWLAWRIPSDVSNAIGVPRGVTLGGFSVTLPQADSGFYRGHFTVSVDEAGRFQWYTGRLERLDVTPPTLSVALNPTTLWPPNDKPTAIAARIAVTDDYDPQPEIKLESIVANESLEEHDIRDAAFGTDDRTFALKAKREGGNKTGRVYTVTYSATDATGNKATASATVTVPHDRRGGE